MRDLYCLMIYVCCFQTTPLSHPPPPRPPLSPLDFPQGNLFCIFTECYFSVLRSTFKDRAEERAKSVHFCLNRFSVKPADMRLFVGNLNQIENANENKHKVANFCKVYG